MGRNLIVGLYFCGLVCLWGGDLQAHLGAFEGRWTGSFTIHSTANGFTENFPVEQQYWMEGDRLRGIAVAQRGDTLETSTSWAWVDEQKLVSEVSRGETVDRYYGALKDGVIIWISSDLSRVEDYQMTERFSAEGGERKLLTEGFDTYLFSGGLAHIIYRGELVWQGAATPGAE